MHTRLVVEETSVSELGWLEHDWSFGKRILNGWKLIGKQCKRRKKT
jgi:hypothetical protein